MKTNNAFALALLITAIMTIIFCFAMAARAAVISCG